jgi:coproporphyrinogen III oxidase-like Fe-S oxidoreductase
VHDAQQAIAAPRRRREAFDTFNLDLMYALPGQDLAQGCSRPGRTALALQPAAPVGLPPDDRAQHRRFANAPPAGLPDDDLASDMLDLIAASAREPPACSATKCRPSRSRATAAAHNLNYWQFGDYLGIGAGAHGKLSFPHRVVRQVRWREPATPTWPKRWPARRCRTTTKCARKTLPFEFMLNALRLPRASTLRCSRAHRSALSGAALAQAQRAAWSRSNRDRRWSRPRAASIS